MTADDLAWQADALCAQTDPEAFFPEKGGSTRDAKRICLACDVRAQCLAYAMETGERFGIWGGVSERARRKLRRARPQPEPLHGSEAMYRKGCKDPEECPRSERGRSCFQAHRDAQNKREAQKRANGGRAA